MERAACKGTHPSEIDPLFFPGKGEDTEPGKAICRTCPVVSECLELALATNERHGTWGGMAIIERKRYRARQRTAAA